MPCPAYPIYAGDDLGAFPDGNGTTFRVWAPTASGVVLRLFAVGSPGEAPGGADAPTGGHALAPGPNGTWRARCDGVGHGTYYDYVVRFPDGTATRTACGKTMCQKPCILVMPQARLASIWAELTEESAPRSVSDM